MIHFRAIGKTDKGVVRANNEDNYCVDELARLLIVSDGVGGQEAGEVASKLAVEVTRDQIHKFLDKEQNHPLIGEKNPNFSDRANNLASAIRVANQMIFETSKKYSANHGMGATIVAVQIGKYDFSVAHVGDSRLYWIHNGQIQQLTNDHSLVMEQVRQGLITLEEAKVSKYKNILLRVLGQGETVEIDIDEMPLSDGDYLLICSDGLYNMVDDETLLKTVLELKDPAPACDKLIKLANEAGGKDNITVIIAEIIKETMPWYKKSWIWFKEFLKS